MKRQALDHSFIFQRPIAIFSQRKRFFHWIMDNLREGNRLPLSR